MTTKRRADDSERVLTTKKKKKKGKEKPVSTKRKGNEIIVFVPDDISANLRPTTVFQTGIFSGDVAADPKRSNQ